MSRPFQSNRLSSIVRKENTPIVQVLCKRKHLVLGPQPNSPQNVQPDRQARRPQRDAQPRPLQRRRRCSRRRKYPPFRAAVCTQTTQTPTPNYIITITTHFRPTHHRRRRRCAEPAVPDRQQVQADRDLHRVLRLGHRRALPDRPPPAAEGVNVVVFRSRSEVSKIVCVLMHAQRL